MKRLFQVAAASIVASLVVTGPAAAQAAHQIALDHDGATLSVSYEPRTTTRLRQGGLAPAFPRPACGPAKCRSSASWRTPPAARSRP